MARIRTIKPEFFDSPGTARASFQARLLFIAMWCWADDYGVGTANPKALMSFAFPNDDLDAEDFPSLRKELQSAFDVAFYESDGRPLYYIPSWDDHQKTQRKAKGRYPKPDGIIPSQSDSCGTSERTQGTSERTQGNVGTGTGEQGNRGTGEQGRAKRATALPKDWTPSESNITYAAAQGLDLQHEIGQFTSNHLAKGSTFKSWDAAFRTWLGKSVEYRRPGTGRQQAPVKYVTPEPSNNPSPFRLAGLFDEEAAS